MTSCPSHAANKGTGVVGLQGLPPRRRPRSGMREFVGTCRRRRIQRCRGVSWWITAIKNPISPLSTPETTGASHAPPVPLPCKRIATFMVGSTPSGRRPDEVTIRAWSHLPEHALADLDKKRVPPRRAFSLRGLKPVAKVLNATRGLHARSRKYVPAPSRPFALASKLSSQSSVAKKRNPVIFPQMCKTVESQITLASFLAFRILPALERL